MIIVRIWEGLGNQMFQYAYARAMKEKGITVRLDLNEAYKESFSILKMPRREQAVYKILGYLFQILMYLNMGSIRFWVRRLWPRKCWYGCQGILYGNISFMKRNY